MVECNTSPTRIVFMIYFNDLVPIIFSLCQLFFSFKLVVYLPLEVDTLL